MKEFTFIWFIENYGYCWHDVGDELESPPFFVEIMQNTSWSLEIYPRGETDPNCTSLYLNRSPDCNGPEKISLNYELSLQNPVGTAKISLEITEDEFEFEKGEGYGSHDFMHVGKNNLKQIDQFLSSGTLKVCCTMWKDDGKVDKEARSYARTRIGYEKISFISIIENFAVLKSNEKKSFQVKSASKDGLKLHGHVHVDGGPGSEEVVIVNIYSDSKNVYFITCQIYLINSVGKEICCGKTDTTTDNDSRPHFSVPINIRKMNLLDDKLVYLPNDCLTLRCECTVSTGIEFQRIEETYYDLHLTPFFEKVSQDLTVSSTPAKQKGVLDDLRSLYKEKIVSDVQLKTASKTFSAHKSVLSARSPVFRAMLTTNMKEKIMACIEIDDLDDIIIDQFLIFLYTDDLEDLQWESAMKLYYAADKYQIELLKCLCSSFLIARLDFYNVTHLLSLADRHEDSSLKTNVENFISKNSKKIFCTHEWECFMDSNPKLAMKTMHFYLKNNSE